MYGGKRERHRQREVSIRHESVSDAGEYEKEGCMGAKVPCSRRRWNVVAVEEIRVVARLRVRLGVGWAVGSGLRWMGG